MKKIIMKTDTTQFGVPIGTSILVGATNAAIPSIKTQNAVERKVKLKPLRRSMN
jgi:hypothetical protein